MLSPPTDASRALQAPWSPRLRGAALWLALCAVSCERQPQTLADCDDLACRVAWLEARPDLPREELRVALKQVQDPVDRELVIMRLVETQPGRTAVLCGLLPQGAARRRCTAIQDRPHLWLELPSGEPEGGRLGGGPTSRRPLPSDDVVSPYADVLPVTAHCEATADPNSCQGLRARGAAQAGDPAAAAALCRGMSDDRWREECLFMAAEEAIDHLGVEAYKASSELCLGSGRFASNCQVHLVILLASRLPAVAGVTGDWQRALAIADRIQSTWLEVDPAFGAVMLGRFWAEVTFRSIMASLVPAGDLLDVLPSEAAPHLRAAVAWRMFRDGGGGDLDLDGWVERLSVLLQARAGVPAPCTTAPLYDPVEDFWGRDGEGEEEIPALVYISTARRATSEDLAEDLTICVLEAAARHDEGGLDIVRQGVSSPHPLAAWTATRLLDRAARTSGDRKGQGPRPKRRLDAEVGPQRTPEAR